MPVCSFRRMRYGVYTCLFRRRMDQVISTLKRGMASCSRLILVDTATDKYAFLAAYLSDGVDRVIDFTDSE